MKLSPEQSSAMARWHVLSSGRKIADLQEAQKILGLEHGQIAADDYELDGHFAFPVDTAEFDPDDIEDKLAPSRYDALTEGQRPTAEELEIWKEKKESLVFEQDGGWFHFYLWRIDLPEGPIYFRSLHGDGGFLDYFDGPFSSEEETLADAGHVELSPREQSRTPN